MPNNPSTDVERTANTLPNTKSVCILLQYYYDIDVRVRRKAEALVEAGYSVDVLALRRPNSPKAYSLGEVKVRTIALGKERGSLVRYAFEYLAFFLWCFVRVSIQMPSRQYALIDVNTLPDFLVFASIIAKWMGAQVVLDMHEITPEFYRSKYGMPEKSWGVRLMKILERMSFSFADHVITVNDPIQELLVNRGLLRHKSTVVMNSVDEARFASCSKSSAAVDAAAVSSTFVMMYHGTITRIYGLDIAIDAFELAHKDMPGAEFWILANEPNPALEQLVEERRLASKVRLFGFIVPSEIPAWLNRCDVGILPMRRDVLLELASPNKLSEYIIMGKPIVTSRLKALTHYFSESALACFEPENAGDLAKQMVRLYRNPELRTRMAAKAKEEYAPIRWDVMKQRYLTAMAHVAGPAPSTAERSRVAETTV